MKRWTILCLLCLLLCLCAPAHAEDAFDVALEVHPGAVIVSQAIGNDVAAAALRTPDSDRLRLCVTRCFGDTWRLIINNPTAFPDIPETPEIMFDTDGESLFWRYTLEDGKRVLTYRSWCFSGLWSSVSMSDHDVDDYSIAGETHIYYQDGYVYRKEIMEDPEGNLLSQTSYIPLKADWAAREFALSSFDAESELVPLYEEYDSWPGYKALEQTARELFPEDTFLGGSIPWNELDLRMLMRRKDGKVVLRCIRDLSQGKDVLPRYDVTESAPLPDNTYYGVENFTNSLGISIPGSRLLSVDVAERNGVWGVSMSYDRDMIFLGSNWMRNDMESHIFIGEHPWSDITKIDWTSLPHTWQEALDALDTSHYAVVNNPDPADRLHLRALPDRSSRSLGKYYNGTPAKVLESEGDWVQVDVLGQTGWMLRRYLAFGEDVKQVASAFNKQFALESRGIAPVYLDTDGLDIIAYDSTFLIAGILGDEWYHVWLPDKGIAGYVKQENLWPGNG